jgi:predicted RNA binding protein YcfA (HicA-like mRNA interferase family)
MKLPVVSGSEAVKALERLGYEFDEQHGNHIILRHANPPHRRLSVPNHKELAKGTLRALIREAGLTWRNSRDFSSRVWVLLGLGQQNTVAGNRSRRFRSERLVEGPELVAARGLHLDRSNLWISLWQSQQTGSRFSIRQRGE